jgi:hypothetical protein
MSLRQREKRIKRSSISSSYELDGANYNYDYEVEKDLHNGKPQGSYKRTDNLKKKRKEIYEGELSKRRNKNQTINKNTPIDVDTIDSPIISFVVVTEDGIDNFNKGCETYIDIVADKNTTFQKINDSIIFTLIVNDATEILYKLEESDNELDLSLTLKKLGIKDGTMVLAISKNSQAETTLQDIISNDNDIDNDLNENKKGLIELNCVTRICDSYGEPFTNIKVLVQQNGLCKDFMEDIGTLWNKNGLKFKIGRIVLNSNKTFKQMEIKDGMEVKITGGRQDLISY